MRGVNERSNTKAVKRDVRGSRATSLAVAFITSLGGEFDHFEDLPGEKYGNLLETSPNVWLIVNLCYGFSLNSIVTRRFRFIYTNSIINTFMTCEHAHELSRITHLRFSVIQRQLFFA